MTSLDSNVFIYILENHAEFSEASQTAITQTIQAGESMCVSALVFTEVLSGTNDPKALAFLKALPAIVYDLNQEIAITAGNLRRQNGGLKTADAIHIATAIQSGAARFITNDKKLLKLKLGIEMLPLMSFGTSRS